MLRRGSLDRSDELSWGGALGEETARAHPQELAHQTGLAGPDTLRAYLAGWSVPLDFEYPERTRSG